MALLMMTWSRVMVKEFLNSEFDELMVKSMLQRRRTEMLSLDVGSSALS